MKVKDSEAAWELAQVLEAYMNNLITAAKNLNKFISQNQDVANIVGLSVILSVSITDMEESLKAANLVHTPVLRMTYGDKSVLQNMLSNLHKYMED